MLDAEAASKRLRKRADGLRSLAQDFDPKRQERAVSACHEAAAILRDAAREVETPIDRRYAALDAP